MKKILVLGVLLATGGCQGTHQRLGMMHEEENTASETHRTWFKSFVDALDHEYNEAEEKWSAVDKVLDEGQKNKQLDVTLTWPEGEQGREYTPLHYAAAKGDVAIVRELVEQRGVPVDIRTQEDRSTPLHAAASQGHWDVVKFLVENGAEVDGLNKVGASALHYAAAGGKGENNRDVIEYLVEKGADLKKLTQNDVSLLALAILHDNLPVIEYWEDKFSNNLDPEIDKITERALKMAKYRRSAGYRGQELIIGILKKLCKSKSK